jgi:hypothetical protein
MSQKRVSLLPFDGDRKFWARKSLVLCFAVSEAPSPARGPDRLRGLAGNVTVCQDNVCLLPGILQIGHDTDAHYSEQQKCASKVQKCCHDPDLSEHTYRPRSVVGKSTARNESDLQPPALGSSNVHVGYDKQSLSIGRGCLFGQFYNMNCSFFEPKGYMLTAP